MFKIQRLLLCRDLSGESWEKPAGSVGTLWRLAVCTARGLLQLPLAVEEAPQARSSWNTQVMALVPMSEREHASLQHVHSAAAHIPLCKGVSQLDPQVRRTLCQRLCGIAAQSQAVSILLQDNVEK